MTDSVAKDGKTEGVAKTGSITRAYTHTHTHTICRQETSRYYHIYCTLTLSAVRKCGVVCSSAKYRM